MVKMMLWFTAAVLVMLGLLSLPVYEEEEAEYDRRVRKQKTAKKMIRMGYMLVWLLLIFLKIIPDTVNQIKLNQQVRSVYFEAQELAVQEQYAEAVEHLKSVNNVSRGTTYITWWDYDTLMWYCEAMEAYEAGDWETVLDKMPQYRLTYLDDAAAQTDPSARQLYQRRDKVLRECEKLKREEEQRIYEKGLREAQHSQPFVGMQQRYIFDTVFGSPYKKVSKHPWKQSPVTDYYFYYAGFRYIVTCQDGEVTDVSYSSYSGSHSSGSSHRGDPYDVYDYDDPEDFYEDYFDDFDGYEDAEDYYYDHHG